MVKDTLTEDLLKFYDLIHLKKIVSTFQALLIDMRSNDCLWVL